MILIDTHTHLFASEFDEDRREVVQRAIALGVEKLILPNIDASTLDSMLEMLVDYPKNCFAMVGLHPGSVGVNYKEELNKIKESLLQNKERCVAIGEIGMDLYWDKSFVNEQRLVFAEQVKWAKELKLPIAIHAREAFDEIFEVLDELNDEHLTGVFHCFTGNIEQAQHILNYEGFKLGIGGVLTYKKSNLPQVLSTIDLKNIILETDSPYLSPVPFRGKRNESSFILHVAEKLSDVYQLPLEVIATETSKNALQLFPKINIV